MVSIISIFQYYRFTQNEMFLERIKSAILGGTCTINESDNNGDNLLMISLKASLGQPKKYKSLLDKLSKFLINNRININIYMILINHSQIN